MSGILRLESLTKGDTLKQGDKTPLKYRLFDVGGEKLSVAGKPAKVRLAHRDFLTIGYEKDGLTVAQDDTVTFTIDSIIPPRIYYVEIIVDDKFIFPSRPDESKFTVNKSSLGVEADIIQIIGKEEIVRDVKARVENELVPFLEEIEQAEAQRQSNEQIVKFKAEEAITKANQADNLSKSVQSQFNQVVIDGDSSVEAAQARVDASGHTNATLKERLDKEHNEVNAQLAQTELDVRSRSVNVKNPPEGLQPALGDGVTDDTTAIKEMLNYVADYGGSLFFPEGTYLITSTLVIPSGVSLIGVNNRNSSLVYNGKDSLIQFQYNTSYIKLYNLDLKFTGQATDVVGILLEANLLTTSSNIRISGFHTGIRIDGKDRWCASNTFYDIDTLGCFYGIHITADSGKQSNHNNFFGGYLYGEPTLKEGSKGIFIERGDSNTFFGTAVEEFDVGYHFKALDSGGNKAFAPRAEACNTNYLIEPNTINTQLFGPLNGRAVEHGIRNLSQGSSIYTRIPTFVGNNLYWGSGDEGSLKFLSGGVPKTVLKQEEGNMEFYSPGVYSRDYKFNIRDSAQVNREEFTISTGKIRTRVDFEIGGKTGALPDPSVEYRGRIRLVKSTTYNEPDRLFICVKKANAGLDEFEWKEL